MKTSNNTLVDRLIELTNCHGFKWNGKGINTPEDLILMGEYSCRQWEKLEDMGPDMVKRVESILCNIFAGIIQDRAINEWGDTEPKSIKKAVKQLFNDDDYWEGLQPIFRQGLVNIGLSDEQCRIIIEHFFDLLPQVVIEIIRAMVLPTHLLPRAAANSIAIALADLMTEVGNDNRS